MLTNPHTLPCSSKLDIKALSSAFKTKSSSYKFLWMLAILRSLEYEQFPDGTIPIHLLAAHMFDLAKYPLRRFHLSFGWHDKVDVTLTNLENAEGWHNLKNNIFDKEIAKQNLKVPKYLYKDIVQFVPYRMLSPFFKEELKGYGAAKKKQIIINRAAATFNTDQPPFYRLSVDGEHIQLHPSWQAYFEQNMEILKAWAKWHWANFLQNCNPNIPAIMHKLEKPNHRKSLLHETKFWRWVIAKNAGQIKCIYSKKVLHANDFSLDHYIPWDFIAHDQIWNLVPVTKECNEKKSNQLPDNSFLPSFVETQHTALRVYSEADNKWEALMESYFSELHLGSKEIAADLGKLHDAYGRVMQPLLQLAENHGFKRWQHVPPLAN